MRVLIVSVPGYGHLQPLLPLASALADGGHEVAIATGSDLRSRAESAGFVAFDAGLSLPAAFASLAERFPDAVYNRLAPAEILNWYLPHLFAETLAPAMLRDLEPLLRSWRPDVVVHDTWEFASPIAAASANLPSVSQTLGLRFGDDLMAAAACAVAPLWRQRRLSPDSSAGLYRSMCLDITPPSLQPYGSAVPSNVLRPLRPVALPPLPGEHLPSWMQHRRQVPLVYMTLGTNTNSDTSIFRSVVDGLGTVAVDVLITVGSGNDPAVIGQLPDNVHVEQYVPQSLLLPQCALVICHGGAGTTLNALALGLPLLVLPQGADQYIVADLVVASGAGRRLKPTEVTPATVRSSVLALLSDPACQHAADRLRLEIEAMPSPRDVVPVIEELAIRGR
jgi:UDP:flavonoid glycosyltransferase YjiC (YdhE family)